MPPAELWQVLTDTAAYPSWWPWLRTFDPVPLEPGVRTQCVIRPPLPYVLTVEIEVVDVVAGERLDASVTGDVRGPARLEVAAAPGGSAARLVWDLEVQRPLLRAASRMARPVLQWGHDWVVANGVEQFRRAAVSSRRLP